MLGSAITLALRCFAASGQHRRKEVLAMDAQTIIAICALLSVVIGIVKLGSPRD